MPSARSSRRVATLGFIPLVALGLAACQTEALVVGGAVAATALAARAPTHEVQQVYYIGLIDPEEQVPPSLYRLRVHGQASPLSSKTFASGWVPAAVADSLDVSISLDPRTDTVRIDDGGSTGPVPLAVQRRLVMFGPEGFREAPADHRLVIVVGSDPGHYFEAADRLVTQATRSAHQERLEAGPSNRRLLAALLALEEQERRFAELAERVERP